MNMTNSGRRSTSVPRGTNGQDQTTPEHVTVASVSLSAPRGKSLVKIAYVTVVILKSHVFLL